MKIRINSICFAIFLMLIPQVAAAQNNDTVSGEKGTDMLVDAVLLRPLGLATTLAGVVLTVVALPFTIPSGSVQASARELISKPAVYTFKRPLGDFGNDER